MLDGASIFPKLPEDAAAFVFTPERFGASPDGTGDNTAAMQAVVDELERTQEYGILFIPCLLYTSPSPRDRG